MTATRIVRLGLMIAIALCASASPTLAQSGTLTTLHAFVRASDGCNPSGGLIQAKDGNFYGTAGGGGTYEEGTAFRITPAGQFTVLHTFGGGQIPALFDGIGPCADLVQGRDGNLYGTTAGGGYYGNGTIFKLTLAGTETILYSFTGGLDGGSPLCTLIQAANGDFYGTTYDGGYENSAAYKYGTVFKITPSGQFTVLHAFSGYNSGNPALSDGGVPFSGLVQGRDGNFYGTTSAGGTYNRGAIYRITPQGVLTILYSFPNEGVVAGSTLTPLVLGRDGNFYGTTSDEFFRITPDGEYAALLAPNGLNGWSFYNCDSHGGLIQASDGNFYGTTWDSAFVTLGYVYQLSPKGVLTVIYSFTGGEGGFDPNLPLLQASDGDFYGMTYENDVPDFGTIYRLHYLDPVPTLTQLSPNTLPAGGPAFTLTVSGKNFAADASVNWNGTPLTTTFVSVNKLTATVPASAIAAAGNASVTVTNPAPGGGTTAALTFTVTVTSLSVKVGKLTRDSTTGAITVPLTLKNTGYASAPSLMITGATLSQTGTTTALSVSLGTLAAGASTKTSLTFPGSAGASGIMVTLNVSGTYTGGTFSSSSKVRLP